jgi:hypothetical protein
MIKLIGTCVRGNDFHSARKEILEYNFVENRTSDDVNGGGLFYFQSKEASFDNFDFLVIYGTNRGKPGKPGMYCETRGINYFGLKLSWLVGDDPNEFIWVEILKNQTLGKDTKLLAAAFLNLQILKIVTTT